MKVRAALEKLRHVFEPGRSIVTVTLDLSGSALLPEETRVFVKDLSIQSPAPGGESARSRSARADLIARIQGFLDTGIRPGVHGLFLAAGADHWDVVELQVRLPNFVYLGSTPYLPPLAEALERSPRILVAQCGEREAVLTETELGLWNELERWNLADLDQDPERGFAGRDRFERSLATETTRLLARVGRRVGARQIEAPSEMVFFFGEAERYSEFRNHLPTRVRDRAEYLGAPPPGESLLRHRVELERAKRYARRREAETLEFQERRRQGHLVALGPGDVLDARTRGHLARVFVDAETPVPGSQCFACSLLQAGEEAFCGSCGSPKSSVSLTQMIVSHALAHPPLPVTFVRHPSDWLADLGGMAGLLSTKGIRGKR